MVSSRCFLRGSTNKSNQSCNLESAVAHVYIREIMIESEGPRQHFPLFELSEEFSHYFAPHAASGMNALNFDEYLHNIRNRSIKIKTINFVTLVVGC